MANFTSYAAWQIGVRRLIQSMLIDYRLLLVTMRRNVVRAELSDGEQLLGCLLLNRHLYCPQAAVLYPYSETTGRRNAEIIRWRLYSEARKQWERERKQGEFIWP